MIRRISVLLVVVLLLLVSVAPAAQAQNYDVTFWVKVVKLPQESPVYNASVVVTVNDGFMNPTVGSGYTNSEGDFFCTFAWPYGDPVPLKVTVNAGGVYSHSTQSVPVPSPEPGTDGRGAIHIYNADGSFALVRLFRWSPSLP